MTRGIKIYSEKRGVLGVDLRRTLLSQYVFELPGTRRELPSLVTGRHVIMVGVRY